MADLSKIQINGVDYGLKDETARQNSGGDVDLTGYATEQFVQERYQPKGDYLTEVPDGYATEEFVKNKIAEAELGGEEVDLSGYAQKSEIPTKISQLENDSGYLTEHQDISGLLPRTELSSAINTALEQAKESGEFNGDDYVLTEEDKNEIANQTATLVEVYDGRCNPEMFGAVGDGVTDDTEAIRECIEYANTNRINVKFDRNKRYKVNQTKKITAYCSIDFNYSTIVLSGGSTNPFINIAPLERKSYTLTADSLTEHAVSNAELFNKCMTIETPINLGVRNHETATEQAYVQTMMTDMNGNFINGKLECEIVDGSYTIKNVHDYRIPTLEIKNVTVDYSEVPDYETAVFIDSIRSNVKLDNITIVGDVIINEWSRAVLGISNSCNIEVSNIRGNSPYSIDGSGYIIGLYEVTDVYLHDCDFGGSTSQWSCMGGSYISNFVAERVNSNNLDCHYYFTGYYTARDCNVNKIKICGGNGELTFERVNITVLDSRDYVIERRVDLDIMPSGTIKFSECTFKGGTTAFKWSCPTPDTNLLANIKYEFTHFIFDNCKVLTSNVNLAYFELSSGWDNVFVDIINAHTGWRTLHSFGETNVKRAIIRGCTFVRRSHISGCDEVIIKECHGDTVYVTNTNNSCILCDNIFTPTETTLIESYAAIIANNVILQDKSLTNNTTKYVVSNNLPLYDTYKSTWANTSK